MISAFAVAYPSLSKSAAISVLVDAPAIESTTIVTNLFLSDERTLSVITSMVSKISSTVSNGMYNISFKFKPIALRYSVAIAFSVSI